MSPGHNATFERYTRQMVFPGIGLAGQRRILGSRGLVVGVGGLGSWTAELLARAGLGTLALVDDDRVDITNLHRQGLYDQHAAQANAPKVQAAAQRLRRINDQVTVEPLEARLDKDNIAQLARDADVILDGTDNFATRFVINDYAVKTGTPWVFAGVVAAEGQVMTVASPHTPCLRCVFDEPPPPCVDPACQVAGVLGPAVAAVAAVQACQAVKLLAGGPREAVVGLIKLDLWHSTVQQIGAPGAARRKQCPCCGLGHYDYLER